MTRKRFIKVLMGMGASKKRAQKAVEKRPKGASYKWWLYNGGMTEALAKWYGVKFDGDVLDKFISSGHVYPVFPLEMEPFGLFEEVKRP